MNMRQRYKYYSISNETVDLEYSFVTEDCKGDWDNHREVWRNKRDEEGVYFYTFKEEENRMELTCLDPEGNGYKEVLSRSVA